MNKKEETINTYNQEAGYYANKFNKLDRTAYVYEVFKLYKTPKPKVLELGCGNGRDAKVIGKFTNDYLGIDLSEEFIKLARSENPKLKFELADMENFVFPEKIDIVFSFASFLHIPKESFKQILQKLHKSLNTGGLIKISTKWGEKYEEIEKTDKYGVRHFYFYCEDDIKEISTGYKVIKMIKEEVSKNIWLEIILQKE